MIGASIQRENSIAFVGWLPTHQHKPVPGCNVLSDQEGIFSILIVYSVLPQYFWPINLLRVISKLSAKHLLDKFTEWLKQEQVLANKQVNFRKTTQ